MPAAETLARFAVMDPKILTITDIAHLWKVRRRSGETAILKCYKDGDEKDEGAGLDLLRAWDGNGAVRLLDRAPGAALMEYLPGKTLGDLCRSGEDLNAARFLAETARRLHAASPGAAGLLPLAKRCRPLLNYPASDDVVFGLQMLCRDLLDSAPAPVALHGDLHHDNVLHGAAGWCAIDPKGIWGDPAYETANAFRNPIGADHLWRDTDRARRLAEIFSKELGHPATRLIGWAAVHAMLSILWDDTTPPDRHPDRDLPARYLALYQTF